LIATLLMLNRLLALFIVFFSFLLPAQVFFPVVVAWTSSLRSVSFNFYILSDRVVFSLFRFRTSFGLISLGGLTRSGPGLTLRRH